MKLTFLVYLIKPLDMFNMHYTFQFDIFLFVRPISSLIAVPMSTVAASSAAVTKVSRTRLSPSRSRSERPSVRLVYGQGSLR